MWAAGVVGRESWGEGVSRVALLQRVSRYERLAHAEPSVVSEAADTVQSDRTNLEKATYTSEILSVHPLHFLGVFHSRKFTRILCECGYLRDKSEDRVPKHVFPSAKGVN